MYDHNSSVFNNSCLKVPRNPNCDYPLPAYEQKYLNQLENEARKLCLQSHEFKMKSKKVSSTPDKETTKSFIDFYDSIPEYDEINHLSNKEFYKQLENLKEKQKLYYQRMQNEIKYDIKETDWIEDYKNMKIGEKKIKTTKKRKSSIKPFCTTPNLNKSPNLGKHYEDVECFSLSKPPSRRSVRIETPSEKLSPDDTPEPRFRPKSRINLSSASSKGINNEWDDLSIDDYNLELDGNTPLPLSDAKSVPNSPTKAKNNAEWNDDGITIPKPFQMTVRDEENKIVDELYIKMKKPKEDKSELFKAHDIPIESQIPLFDKIMADQERKNFLVRERRKAALNAQMRPFSFTRRDEEIQELTKRLSKSTPSLYLEETPLKIRKFKAKPIPKNLFSNYIYKKMHEDEFYRALQKKIRAEEMLKAASLPPSMAKREKTKPIFDVCPRSYRDLWKASEKSKKTSNFGPYHDRLEKELEILKNEFISTTPRPFKLKTSKRGDKKGKKYFRQSSASSKSSYEARTPSTLELQAINRSNLAAVLRIQSARKRLEQDMCRKLEEAKLKEEARWREKLMRKKPVWQTLAYSHEEDLAMRLQLRRDEERLRSEEHRLRMQHMLGRVNQQPTLFERQSQTKYPRTKEELMNKLYGEYPASKKLKLRRRSFSDMSDLRSMVEMKDEAIQAFLEEHAKTHSSSDSDTSKESLPEEKEKCESLGSDDNEKSN